MEFSQNTYIFILETAFQNVVYNMSAILFLPQCVQFQKNYFLLFIFDNVLSSMKIHS